jgi:hypothetical protein
MDEHAANTGASMDDDRPKQKIGVHNDRKDAQPITIWIEPIAEDFTLLAGESLELVAYGITSAPSVDLVQSEQDLQIYLEGGRDIASVDEMLAMATDFVVTQNGVRLECGHNRCAREQT